MARIGLFFGSTDGATERVAQRIQSLFDERGRHEVVLHDVADVHLSAMGDFDYLILGVPTWNLGQLQDDWDDALDELDEVRLDGVAAAIFGLGDQLGYPDTFADAMFFIAEKVRTSGAMLVGRWPTSGYCFTNSWALVDGDFLGLVLDEENQAEMTEARLVRWLTIVCAEFGLEIDG